MCQKWARARIHILDSTLATYLGPVGQSVVFPLQVFAFFEHSQLEDEAVLCTRKRHQRFCKDHSFECPRLCTSTDPPSTYFHHGAPRRILTPARRRVHAAPPPTRDAPLVVAPSRRAGRAASVTARPRPAVPGPGRTIRFAPRVGALCRTFGASAALSPGVSRRRRRRRALTTSGDGRRDARGCFPSPRLHAGPDPAAPCLHAGPDADRPRPEPQTSVARTDAAPRPPHTRARSSTAACVFRGAFVVRDGRH